ncbi:MAG: hypothetical protein KAW02_04485 [candidate division Zixibacteria bacterium]|nr:hypothetical protein [candidate division Zixibacteria bacterium]
MIVGKTKWELAEPKKQFLKFFKTHREKTKYIPVFQEDVTENPFYQPKHPKRIKKLAPQDDYPPDSYRWKMSDLRIVYSLMKKEKIVLPLDADVAGDIGYR